MTAENAYTESSQEADGMGTQPTGPTDHLDTVEYWKGLYFEAIKVGQEMATAIRQHHADISSLGVNSRGQWGSSYDHKLWAVLTLQPLPTRPVDGYCCETLRRTGSCSCEPYSGVPL